MSIGQLVVKSRRPDSIKDSYMYFAGLSPYTCLNRPPDPNLLTIGWLDAEHDFPKGKVSEDVLEKILALCFKPVNQTRGFHLSPFLSSPILNSYIVEYKEKKWAWAPPKFGSKLILPS